MADWDVVSETPVAAGGQWEVAAEKPAVPLAMADVAKGALTNAPASAVKFAQDMIHPVLHPIETATAIKNVGHGVLQKTGIMSGEENIPSADAVGKFFKDRYGSLEAAKKSLAEDPVGVAADLSMLLTGGAALPARAGGMVGKVGQAVGAAGRAVDPLTAVGTAVKGTGAVASELIGGLGTGTGGESVRIAAKAGYEGGAPAQAFQESMRGAVPIENVVADARNAVKTMRDQRGSAYKSGMAGVAADTTALDFAVIDKALHDAQLIKTYKGQNLSPSTEGIAKKLQDTVNEWKALDPAEFHTAEGLDALKQKIGDIRDATQYGTPERVAADRVYHGVRNTITTQVPEYAKVMKGYEQASTQIKEIERTLSLNPNASVDTALRKLQSVLRNNVHANYGKRAELADFLVKSGSPQLMQALAGQAMNAWMPRGLQKLGMQLGLEMLFAGASIAPMGAASAAYLPLASPRLVGEAAYYTGKAAKHAPARPVAQAGYQADRERQR